MDKRAWLVVGIFLAALINGWIFVYIAAHWLVTLIGGVLLIISGMIAGMMIDVFYRGPA